MKFLTKINRNYLLLLTVTLVVVAIGGYFILQAIILDGTKETLLRKEWLIKNQIIETGELPNIFPIIEVKKINLQTIGKPSFKEIFIQNDVEGETEPFLEYSNELQIKGSYYSIKIRQSVLEDEDLASLLGIAFFILLLAAFLISFFFTKKMNRTVWSKFEHNLKAIEEFSFSGSQNLNLLKSDIQEFDRLNLVVEKLTKKLTTDYLSLKEFTENASHEIQTPLTIALLNLDELLQQNPDEASFKKVLATINALKRLSNLNQSLILLTKIENRQFQTEEVLSVKKIVNEKIEEFAALFELKNLKVECSVEQDFVLNMNVELAGLLLNNLLSNAIHHNLEGGSIQLAVRQNEFKICNTGEPNSLTDETIFKRFAKANSKSYGLGLAIVKKICDVHHLEIHYTNKNFHCFTIKKNLQII